MPRLGTRERVNATREGDVQQQRDSSAKLCASPRFSRNGDLLAAQPPKRSFDRPVRSYLGYLRAREFQSATLPLVYVTCGGSDLPARQKKRPRVPAGHCKTGSFPRQERVFLAAGDISRHTGISLTAVS